MTNIPKKLDGVEGIYAINLKNKINELIDYLRVEVKQDGYSWIPTPPTYTFFTNNQEEASKGDKTYIFNGEAPIAKYVSTYKERIISKDLDLDPDNTPASKGECRHKPCNGWGCEECNQTGYPPEQENEFFKLIMEYKLSDFTHMAKMISKELKSEYISKEKIKEYVSDKLNCYSNTDYRVALKDLSESLGLGD